MRATSDITTFDFRYVTRGNTAFGKRHGAIGAELTLDDTTVRWEQVAHTTVRGERLVIVLHAGVQLGKRSAKYLVDEAALVIQPAGLDARTLEKAIDRRASAREAELHREQLIAEGKGDQVRVVTCPVCKSTVDLSGLESSRYVYCRFCESVFGEGGRDVTDGRRYRTCDECGMFDRIQPYPEFYFYFLLVVYGFRYRQRFLCDACAHRLFLKTLAVNAIFVLGVPTSVWVKIKSMRGREPSFATLAGANALSRGGRYQDAMAAYAPLLGSHPEHPAILTNQALGHIAGKDAAGATKALSRALASCNSYLPALRLAQVRERATGRDT
jgi:hypothetical protein